MDLICVFPLFISKDEFFEKFKEALLNYKSVTYVNDIIEAHIPILKIKLYDICIDLLYA